MKRKNSISAQWSSRSPQIKKSIVRHQPRPRHAGDAVFLSKRMLRFERQSCMWRIIDIWNILSAIKWNRIRPMWLETKRQIACLNRPDSHYDPATSPATEPSLATPPWRQQVWRRRQTAHSWRPVSSPPAKKDDEMPIGANSGNEIDSATLNEQDYKISLISLHREIQSFHSDHGVKEYTTLLDNLIIKTLELIERSELYLQPQPLPPPPRPQ